MFNIIWMKINNLSLQMGIHDYRKNPNSLDLHYNLLLLKRLSFVMKAMVNEYSLVLTQLFTIITRKYETILKAAGSVKA